MGSQVLEDRGELSFEYSEDSILEHSTEVLDFWSRANFDETSL